ARAFGPAPIFKQLRAAKRPADTASKRLNRLLESAGVHRRYTQTLHSLRHTYKEWLENAGIDSKTRKLALGHALNEVHERYGAKRLSKAGLRTLRDLPLPDGLDLSPYLKKKGK